MDEIIKEILTTFTEAAGYVVITWTGKEKEELGPYRKYVALSVAKNAFDFGYFKQVIVLDEVTGEVIKIYE